MLMEAQYFHLILKKHLRIFFQIPFIICVAGSMNCSHKVCLYFLDLNHFRIVDLISAISLLYRRESTISISRLNTHCLLSLLFQIFNRHFAVGQNKMSEQWSCQNSVNLFCIGLVLNFVRPDSTCAVLIWKFWSRKGTCKCWVGITISKNKVQGGFFSPEPLDFFKHLTCLVSWRSGADIKVIVSFRNVELIEEYFCSSGNSIKLAWELGMNQNFFVFFS